MVDDTLILWDRISLETQTHTRGPTQPLREKCLMHGAPTHSLLHLPHTETFVCMHTLKPCTLHINPHTHYCCRSVASPVALTDVCCRSHFLSLTTHIQRHTHTQICIQFTCRLVGTPTQLLTVCQTQTAPGLHPSTTTTTYSTSLSLCLCVSLSGSHLPLSLISRLLLSLHLSLSRSLSPSVGMCLACFSCAGPRLRQSLSVRTHKAAVHQVTRSCRDLHDWTASCVCFKMSVLL